MSTHTHASHCQKDNHLIWHCHACHDIFLVYLWKIMSQKISTDRKVLMISSCHSSIRSIAHSSNNTHLTTQDIFPISKTPYTSYDTTHLQEIFPIRNTHTHRPLSKNITSQYGTVARANTKLDRW